MPRQIDCIHVMVLHQDGNLERPILSARSQSMQKQEGAVPLIPGEV
jgi:hypothetical protein